MGWYFIMHNIFRQFRFYGSWIRNYWFNYAFRWISGKIKKNQYISFVFLKKKLLTKAIDYGEVYIITNAADGWVEYSSK